MTKHLIKTLMVTAGVATVPTFGNAAAAPV